MPTCGVIRSWFRHVSVHDKRRMIALVWERGVREKGIKMREEREQEREKERSPPQIAACCSRDIKIFLIRVRSRLPCFF